MITRYCLSVLLVLIFVVLVALAQQPTFTGGISLGTFSLLPTSVLVQELDGNYGSDVLFCNSSGGWILSRNAAGSWNGESRVSSRTGSCSSVVAGQLGYAGIFL